MSQDHLSNWAQNISPSMTLAISAKAKAMKAEGIPVLNFSAGEPDFDTPHFIKDAAKAALDAGKTKYVAAPGLPELRSALAQKYTSLYNVPNTTNNNILVSPGGKFSCYAAILATCHASHEVLIPTPYWVSYPEMVKLSGATPKFIPTTQESNFKLTPSQLSDNLSPNTRLLILNSPSNPTGAMYSKEELLEILKICLDNNILILSDEIYEHITYSLPHHCLASLLPEANHLIMIASGYSKTFSMTGWRLGTLLAPEHIIKAASSIQSHTTANATSFAQYGALAALEQATEAQQALDTMLAAFTSRRTLITQNLNQIPGIELAPPDGAFYAFPSIKNFGLDSSTFCTRLLEEHNVAAVPGIAFGAEHHIRLSYATSEDVITQGLEKLTTFCQSLTQ